MRTLAARIFSVAAPALLVAVTAGGCAENADATTQSGTSAGSTGASRAAAQPSATAPGAKPGKQATRSACRPADVSAIVTAQAHRTEGDTRMAIITLTNTSRRTCRVEGRPVLTLVNPANETVPLTITEVDEPGTAKPVDLEPGVSAFAGMKWVVCDKGDAECPVGNSIGIGLPGGTASPFAELEEFPAPEKVDITMASVQLGPLMSSHQAVVAW
jgi:hypothetical protein